MSFSTGPGDTAVPSLTGLTQQQARDALKAAGLSMGNITTVNSGTVDKDKVVSSSPGEGEPVKKGDSVDLELASGNVLVPSDLQGGSLEALQRFAAANRVILTISEEESADAEAGTILHLDKAGQLVSLGSELNATVAVAPKEEPTQTPAIPSSEPNPSDSAVTSPSSSE